MPRRLRLLLLLWLVSATAAHAREAFLEAREAMNRGQLAALENLRLETPAPLDAYVASWVLKLQLESESAATVRQFLDQHKGQWVAEKLRSDWLRVLVKQQQWALFEREYPLLDAPPLELSCSYWLRQGTSERKEDQFVREWEEGKPMQGACIEWAKKLAERGELHPHNHWNRVRNLLESRDYNAAIEASQLLDKPSRMNRYWLDKTLSQPARVLKPTATKAKHASATPAPEWAQQLAVVRLSRQDLGAAKKAFDLLHHHWGSDSADYVLAELALIAAQNHQKEALSWFSAAYNPHVMDERTYGWWLRAALREGKWERVLEISLKLPPELLAAQSWMRYWQARAWLQLGHKDKANKALTALAQHWDFYGLLARDEIKKPWDLIAERASTELLNHYRNHVAVQRALALGRLGLRPEAQQEWNWVARQASDAQLIALAQIAHDEGVLDRSVALALSTRDKHNFALRYPTPYLAQVEQAAERENIDPALIYAVIHQESRFLERVRSSAGAGGLMQLIQSTAAWVKKQLQLDKNASVDNPEDNIRMGSFYLAHLLKTLDNNPILAVASYNAGPRNVAKWLPSSAMEGALFIETVPFQETRIYLKRVLSNAMFYEARLKDGKGRNLKASHLLPSVGGPNNPNTPADTP